MTRPLGLAAMGTIMCALAAGFAAPPLYVPGIALLTLATGAWAWVSLAARGARVTRWASRSCVVEDQVLPIVVTVERGWLPFPGGELVPWPGGARSPLTGPRTFDVTTQASFLRRGRHVLGATRLRICDPLGICTRELLSSPTDVLVLPRVEEVRARELAAIAGAGGRAGRSSPDAAALEVDSLGPHRPGTPASRIHWPTVARTGTLMERRLVADVEGLPLVVVDPRAPASEEALDRALRAAASLCVHLATVGGCALLLPGDRRAANVGPDLHAWPTLHARLAVVEPADGMPPAARIKRARTVVWVTPSPSGPSRALARSAGGERYRVSPHPIAGYPVSFTVAGCSGQRLRAGAAARVA